MPKSSKDVLRQQCNGTFQIPACPDMLLFITGGRELTCRSVSHSRPLLSASHSLLTLHVVDEQAKRDAGLTAFPLQIVLCVCSLWKSVSNLFLSPEVQDLA